MRVQRTFSPALNTHARRVYRFSFAKERMESRCDANAQRSKFALCRRLLLTPNNSHSDLNVRLPTQEEPIVKNVISVRRLAELQEIDRREERLNERPRSILPRSGSSRAERNVGAPTDRLELWRLQGPVDPRRGNSSTSAELYEARADSIEKRRFSRMCRRGRRARAQ